MTPARSTMLAALAVAATAAAFVVPCAADEPETASLARIGHDPSFGDGGAVHRIAAGGLRLDRLYEIALDSRGRIVVSGDTFVGRRRPFSGVARFHPDGTLDRSFGRGGIARGLRGEVRGFAVDTRDRVVLTGRFAGPRKKAHGAVRFAENGRLDQAFTRDPAHALAEFSEIAWSTAHAAPGGGVVVVIEMSMGGQNLAGLDARGKMEWRGPAGRDFAVDSRGRALVADWERVTRLSIDGTRDASFGVGGELRGPTGNRVSAFGPGGLAIDGQGRIVVHGFETNAGVGLSFFRFLEDGALDTAFSEDGRSQALNGAPSDADGLPLELAVCGGDAELWVVLRELQVAENGELVGEGFSVQAVHPSAPAAVSVYSLRIPAAGDALRKSFQPGRAAVVSRDGTGVYVVGFNESGSARARRRFVPALRRFDVTSQTPAPLPDLQVAFAETPVVTGTPRNYSFTVAVRTSNAGEGLTQGADVELYFSDDAVLGPGDVYIAETWSGPLGPGGDRVITFQGSVRDFNAAPAWAGTRLLAVVNRDRRQMETDLTNDFALSAPLE